MAITTNDRAHAINASRTLGISGYDYNALARLSGSLRRWHEMQCGTDGGVVSVDDAGVATWQPSNGGPTAKITNKGALLEHRVFDLCVRLGVTYYIQGDPRGCALYLSREPMDDANYSSKGVPIY